MYERHLEEETQKQRRKKLQNKDQGRKEKIQFVKQTHSQI
jgi:hypothetical protein